MDCGASGRNGGEPRRNHRLRATRCSSTDHRLGVRTRRLGRRRGVDPGGVPRISAATAQPHRVYPETPVTRHYARMSTPEDEYQEAVARVRDHLDNAYRPAFAEYRSALLAG